MDRVIKKRLRFNTFRVRSVKEGRGDEALHEATGYSYSSSKDSFNRSMPTVATGYVVVPSLGTAHRLLRKFLGASMTRFERNMRFVDVT